MATTSVRIDSRPYVSSHGSQPRGRGSWAFTFTKGAPTVDVDVTSDNLWWAPAPLTFTEACRSAKLEARRRFPGASIVWAEVQP